MPTRGIQSKLSSGEITEVKIGGTTPGDSAAKIDDLSNLVSEAPITNNTYVRKNGGWVQETIQPNPIDGNLYGRRNELWALVDLDSKLNRDLAEFIPQGVAPAHVEGGVFYNNASKSLSVYSDMTDMTLNLGQEAIVRVFNATGATIVNTAAVIVTGAIGGIPTIELGIATSSATSNIVGVATHDIEAGTEGFITSEGTLSGDFSAFNTGSVLYLSDTVPGEYTTTPPALATQVGTVLDNSASGKMLVHIRSNISIAAMIGYLNEGAVAGTLAAGVPNAIDTYNLASSGNIGLPINVNTGTIQTVEAGLYRVTVSISLNFTSVNPTRVLDVELYDLTGDVINLSMPQIIERDVEGMSFSFSIPVNLLASKEIQIRLSADTNIAGITSSLASFDLESIRLT